MRNKDLLAWAGRGSPAPRPRAPGREPELPPAPPGYVYALLHGQPVLMPLAAAPALPGMSPGFAPAPAARMPVLPAGGNVIPFRPRNARLVRPLSNGTDPWDDAIAKLPDLMPGTPGTNALFEGLVPVAEAEGQAETEDPFGTHPLRKSGDIPPLSS